MCGIAGIVDFENRPILPALLRAMNDAIAHRGPDDEGYVFFGGKTSAVREFAGHDSCPEIKARLHTLGAGTDNLRCSIGLSHRRFSIIDLSANGHQPFFDRERSCCAVFNGEIYNYVELREELKAKGCRFETQSDTEVLLEAYKHWGTECFSRLNGFWAIALYDFRTKQLLLTRDRIGKKPLYWTRLGSRLYFASAINSLLQVPEVRARRQVNPQAAFYWLAYGKKDLNESTCFDGIYSLPAGCWAVANPEFPQNATRFWSVPQHRATEQDISTAEAAKRLRCILEDAVRIRLRADVPLSVELSGGMDSSTLLALAAQFYSGKVTTYTIRFPEDRCNEEPFARLVAQHYQTDYRILESPLSNFWAQILRFTCLEEEPYHSPNLQTNQVIWTQMRAFGTKVSLNGAGGDENFAGYGRYYDRAQVENLRNGRLLSFLRDGFSYSEGRTNIRGLMRPARAAFAQSLAKIWPSRKKRQKLAYFKGNAYKPLELESLDLSQALYSDMTNTLMPYWLRSGDRGFMGIPLEVRAPLLDHRVIEFAFRLPVRYLFREGWHKWILRKAVEDLLPKEVVWRRQKMGFPFPYERFYSENSELIDLILSRSTNPFIDFSAKHHLRKNWNALSFILWYELFFNENLPLFQELEAKGRRLHTAEDYGYRPQFLATEKIW